jgi:hypothetical protein
VLSRIAAGSVEITGLSSAPSQPVVANGREPSILGRFDQLPRHHGRAVEVAAEQMQVVAREQHNVTSLK